MADETAQVEDTGPRTIDELVDLPYSEMTEEEIELLVEWKAANRARDEEHQRRMEALQAHFAEVFGIADDDDDGALRDAFDQTYVDGERIDAGRLQFTVLATPGHTSDSLSYAIDGHVFIGDTLFAPDVGTARCDFPGGRVDAMYASIQRLHAMDDATVLHLCHDYPAGRERRSSMTVGESRRDNRMLRGDTTLADFAQARRDRDAQLPAPMLLYPALQTNIRGGRLPPADANGMHYLKTPVHGEIPPALT